MVDIHIDYLGGLRCRATHGPSGQSITTDAPVDNHGRGETFSPTDLAATSLGTCLATVMGILAEREGIDLSGLKVHVTKEMVSDPLRRLGRLGVRIEMPPGLDEVQKRKLEQTAKTCPVRQSLRAEVESPMEFVYPK